MSTEQTTTTVPALLVVQDVYAPQPGTEYMLQTLPPSVHTVLLVVNPDEYGPDPSVEWDTIISNTGRKDPYQFRKNAYSILRDHSNLDIFAVVDLDTRFEQTWELPLLVPASRVASRP